MPFIAMPTAIPTMPDSAIGVSKQRVSPNWVVSPSVIRKTPPSGPTSSPKPYTVSSSAMASRSARLRACAMDSVVKRSAMSVGLSAQFVGQEGGLFGQLRCGGGVHVREQFGGVEVVLLGHTLAHGRSHGFGLLEDGGPSCLGEDAFAFEVGLDPQEWVTVLPGGDLFVVSVTGVVVGVGVRLHAVGVCFDELGALARAGSGHGSVEDGQYGGDVVAVDPFAVDAVPDALVCQGGCGALFGQRHGDRVLVVLYEEHHGCPEHSGEVQGFVEISLAGGTVAAQGHGHGLFTAQAGCVCDADGVQQLCGERGGLGRDLVGVGVVPGVPITFEEGEYLDGIDAAGHDRRGVAVGGKEPVVLLEHQGSAGLAGLLPVGGGVDG